MAQPKATGTLLKRLRAFMQDIKYVKEPLNAYIVPTFDAHQSEYLAEHDKRRGFVSGFTGSAGMAIITHDHACMWTDGRYFLQASQEMDSNWTLMKEGIPSTPSEGNWLSNNLPASSAVGVDPKLLPYNIWMPLQTQLESSGHKLIPVATNLIDLIWDNQPPLTTNPILPLSSKFSGKPVNSKLQDIRQQMKEKNAQVLVVTALDEIAWCLNLRGCDIEYNPIFFAFLIITLKKVVLHLNPLQKTATVEEHLNSEAGEAVEILPYDKVEEVLKQIVDSTTGLVWLSDSASYGLISIVPTKRLRTEITPIASMKCIKNPVEIAGMKNAHIKDAAALCCYFAWLEKAVHEENVTEVSGAEKLNEFRKRQADYVGPSFATISSVGPHGSIIHYQPSQSTDVPITDKALYLCDSGGQYYDGTTDVTRTLHFGTPTEFEKECYTRVLKGQLKLATAIFPTKIKGNFLDSFARQYLWEVGLDYAHGTGHGIGSYLNVHEGPMGISWKNIPDDPGLDIGMFLSNEPGYYENEKFGIRIEDIVQVVAASTRHNFNNRGFLTFETITLVPKQTKLIKKEMLTRSEIEQLNAYHQKCRDVVGPLLDIQGQREARDWLWKETELIFPACEPDIQTDVPLKN